MMESGAKIKDFLQKRFKKNELYRQLRNECGRGLLWLAENVKIRCCFVKGIWPGGDYHCKFFLITEADEIVRCMLLFLLWTVMEI